MDQKSSGAIAYSGWDGAHSRPRVVIIGGGFGGAAAAKGLRHAKVDILVIDRRNHQIFQPLLYQVATAVLSPSDVAAPLRQLGAGQPNVDGMLAEVTAIDTQGRKVTARLPDNQVVDVPFDFLVVAAGVEPSYYGHDEFAAYAPSLKTLTDAETIRSKILESFELAELTSDPDERRRLMTFVLVGAGPTGVELAATIAQMAQVTLRGNFRHIRPEETKVVVVEGGQRILASFDERLAAAAQRRLERLGVSVRTGAIVKAVDGDGVVAGGERLRAATVLWTAGVAASPLSALAGAPTDRAGRAVVGPELEATPGSGVFVIGDAASVAPGGKPVPGVAQAALQQGAYAARAIRARVEGRAPPPPFGYRDLGSMAVVGKDFALLQSPHFRLSGRLTRLVWAFVHIATLPSLQNRLRVGVQWLWSYFTDQRGSRLIAESPSASRPSGEPHT
ncbi:NAD(P)/FAD-dependent oxidoreductase [Phenylobacterium sp.]|jgi:NADH dehydrogenase|uniref:NAD(P)/FAD-dependent oxidoreductase n=1 Tax=Phenylobacterium sp. TaxID=1871053 RepID=UPI002E37732B|nr:NAD(P)/FAD-dependent oxidoreductase [Phenylobacterium sp.]HEX4712043.1 NAD(P)/FAD-dependent oxidoreductase [Phenylobacterium sp.]